MRGDVRRCDAPLLHRRIRGKFIFVKPIFQHELTANVYLSILMFGMVTPTILIAFPVRECLLIIKCSKV